MKNFIVSSYSGNYEYAVKNNLDILLRDIKLENYNLLVIDSKISSNYPSIEKVLEIKKISIDINSESKSIEKLPYFLSLFIECDLRKRKQNFSDRRGYNARYIWNDMLPLL